MTEPVKEQSKAQKIVGGIFGLMGLGLAVWLIFECVKLLFV